MGTCKYCGLSAGFLSKAHKECEEKHKQGLAEILAVMHSYFKGNDNIQTVLNTIKNCQQLNFTKQEDIEDCSRQSISGFADALKFPVQKEHTQRIDVFLKNINCSRMALNKDGALDKLAMRLHQGVLVSHFVEHIDMAKVEKRSNLVERILPLNTSQKEEVGLKVLDKAASKFLAKGLPTDAEQQEIEAFAHYLALPINNLPVSYQGSSLEKLAQCTVLKQVQRGKLPPSMPISAPIMLSAGESVIWAHQNVKIYQEKIQKEWVGRNSGWSYRVMKGVYYRTGGSKGHAVEHSMMEHQGTGSLIFTNKNLFFYSDTKSIKLPYKKIISIVPYSDGVEIQKDGANAKRLTFQGFDSWFFMNLLNSINI